MKFERYDALVTKIIVGTATTQDRADVANYEANAPERCDKCKARVISQFEPKRVVHDVENCDKKR